MNPTPFVSHSSMSSLMSVDNSSISFPSFLAAVRRSGLKVAQSYDKEMLLHLAEQSLVLEEKVATGCVMIQAVTLLVYFHKQNGISPLEWTRAATDFGTHSDIHHTRVRIRLK